MSIRNEYFNDVAGQRMGFKSRYTEHAFSYSHWIGSTVLFRPEVRYEHAYDQPAYDGGTRKNQFSVAADFLFFYRAGENAPLNQARLRGLCVGERAAELIATA